MIIVRYLNLCEKKMRPANVNESLGFHPGPRVRIGDTLTTCHAVLEMGGHVVIISPLWI